MLGRATVEGASHGRGHVPGWEVDLDALDRFLASDASLEGCMWISDLDGFVDVIRLRPEAWRPLLEDREALVLLTPILALCGGEEGRTEMVAYLRLAGRTFYGWGSVEA